MVSLGIIGKSATIGWPDFSDGYYTTIMEPAMLMEKIEKELKNTKLTQSKKTELQALLKSLDVNANNVIIYAKLKP